MTHSRGPMFHGAVTFARPVLLLAALGVAFAASAHAAGAKVVWLCKPGQRPDPCTPGLSTTVYSPTLH